MSVYVVEMGVGKIDWGGVLGGGGGGGLGSGMPRGRTRSKCRWGWEFGSSWSSFVTVVVVGSGCV